MASNGTNSKNRPPDPASAFVEPGTNHLCSIYTSKAEQFSLVVPFLLHGLEKHEKCIYVLDESTKEVVVEALREAADDLTNGKLASIVFLSSIEAYLEDGHFDPDRMISFLRSAEEDAIREGHAGVRITGEMTWALAGLPGVDRLMEYEANLNYLLKSSKIKAICQYNEARFPPDILLEVLHTHPVVGMKGSIFPNPYYIPPEVYFARMKGEVSREMYEKAKRDIEQRAALKEQKDLAEERLREANRKLQILGGITRHDISNQISVGLGYTELAKGLTEDRKLLQYLDNIEKAQRVILKQLMFSKAYEELGTEKPIWIDLRASISQALGEVEHSGIDVSVRVENLKILADPMVQKIFHNLLVNSMMHGGKVTKIDFSSEVGPDGQLKIICQDDGIGIPDSEKERVFERGYGSNTGLALNLSRDILAITGITIRECGTPGKGARFEIEVPGAKWKRSR